jgi:hypothetical protein
MHQRIRITSASTIKRMAQNPVPGAAAPATTPTGAAAPVEPSSSPATTSPQNPTNTGQTPDINAALKMYTRVLPEPEAYIAISREHGVFAETYNDIPDYIKTNINNDFKRYVPTGGEFNPKSLPSMTASIGILNRMSIKIKQRASHEIFSLKYGIKKGDYDKMEQSVKSVVPNTFKKIYGIDFNPELLPLGISGRVAQFYNKLKGYANPKAMKQNLDQMFSKGPIGLPGAR